MRDSHLSVKSDVSHLLSLLRGARADLKALRTLQRMRRAGAEETVADVRETMVSKLVDAVNTVEGLAKRSASRTRKGGGGVPPKARWYELMADLAKVLDGFLRNAELGEVEAKLETLEKTVEELQQQTPGPAG